MKRRGSLGRMEKDIADAFIHFLEHEGWHYHDSCGSNSCRPGWYLLNKKKLNCAESLDDLFLFKGLKIDQAVDAQLLLEHEGKDNNGGRVDSSSTRKNRVG
jgi:hypothetical protein